MKLDYRAMFFKKSRLKSFTLIELSIVLFIISMLATAGVGVYKKLNPQYASDTKKMKEIQLALDKYYAVHKRLPRPANITVLPTSADFGKEVALTASPGFRKASYGSNGCFFIVGGGVPTVELGLDNDYAFDSYGNRIEYWTHDSIARAVGISYSGIEGNNQIFQNVYLFNTKCSGDAICINRGTGGGAITGTSFTYYTKNDLSASANATGRARDSIFMFSYGANVSTHTVIGPMYNMVVVDAVRNVPIYDSHHNTAYALVSHGKSSLCSYTRTSTSPTTMPTDRRKFNCLSFWNSSSSTYTYSTSNVSAAKPVVFYQGYGKSFDNLVYFETLDQLIANASAIRKFATG